MKILLISRGCPSKSAPHWGNFEKEQALALKRLGHQVVIMSVDQRFLFRYRPIGIRQIQQDGLTFYDAFYSPWAVLHLLGQTICDKLIAKQWSHLYNHIVDKEGTFDIIYSHFLFNTYRFTRFVPQCHTPVVAIEHWSEINKPVIDPFIQKWGDYAYPKTKQVIAVSMALQKALKTHFNTDSVVVNNMVADDFRYLALTKPEKIRFVAIGSLIHRKGFDLLIDAFKQAQLPENAWELCIIGQGQLQRKLQQQIDRNNLTANIHLLGSQSKTAIVQLLNQSYVFVLPSRMETFGVVYIEAMACGLPVIATPCGGPEEFVTDKDGLLVPVDDVNSLTKAIKYMFDHHQEYNPVSIAENCQARFSSSVIAKQLSDIFNNL